MKYDWFIIGGGLSGLAAGIRLAHFGAKVCISEKHSRLGGLNSYYHRNGVEIDTGLHAMTNFTVKNGPKSLPLAKLLRQLRISYDELELREQNHSKISFPGTSLTFTNDFSVLESEVRRTFPDEIDGFRGLNGFISTFNELDLEAKPSPARPLISQYVKNPVLVDMILCPLMYYGSSIENDMDLSQFVIMFKSIFHQGFCRPAKGIRHLIGLLEKRFTESGGELKLKCEVRKLVSKDGKVEQIELSDGSTVKADKIISSAGLLETMNLCDSRPANFAEMRPGNLGFLEIVTLLDKYPSKAIGHDSSIVFFNSAERFNYGKPDAAYDTNSGVICCPNNFRFNEGEDAGAPMLRLTMLASHEKWFSADRKEYAVCKEAAIRDFPGIVSKNIGRDICGLKIELADVFTPGTIFRYTGHINGAIYGSPTKARNGMTHLGNLFLCGTDQGFLGITGSMLSGISIANKNML